MSTFDVAIRHTLSFDEPWCVELFNPTDGTSISKSQRPTFCQAREEALEHGRALAGDRYWVCMTIAEPDRIKLELQEKSVTFARAGKVAELMAPWFVRAEAGNE